jgi:hypothetical protein
MSPTPQPLRGRWAPTAARGLPGRADPLDTLTGALARGGQLIDQALRLIKGSLSHPVLLIVRRNRFSMRDLVCMSTDYSGILCVSADEDPGSAKILAAVFPLYNTMTLNW